MKLKELKLDQLLKLREVMNAIIIAHTTSYMLSGQEPDEVPKQQKAMIMIDKIDNILFGFE